MAEAPNVLPAVGAKSRCRDCQRPITFAGSYWEHDPPWRPRHMAQPEVPDRPAASHDAAPEPPVDSAAPPILRFFAYEHLPPHLQAVSKPIGDLARQMAAALQPSAELTAGLRKLLEAKDCFVRAALTAPPPADRSGA